ncbi:hypothetical protein CAEBREN_13214 [Caenorhabditis brenneri]|uniref:Uncharacterized protein n=1 Tax=Caenorhabditis brenneri TaxID=135651 RepID=G0MEY4_CAEBE|nr:hypothetical protein CAEBREN_13214 [Caenorhabditis brenneri]
MRNIKYYRLDDRSSSRDKANYPSPSFSKDQRVSKRNVTKFQDNYFLIEESQFLNCPAFMNGNKEEIETYVNYGRMKLHSEKLLDLPMDCKSVKDRLIGDLPPFQPLKNPIAFVRNIYGMYELQEVFMSMTWHPDHFFCYAIDSKSSEKLRRSMMTLAGCFDNVYVLETGYDFDRAGHKQDKAHFDCLNVLLEKNWSHAITLQNFDMIIKTPEQLSDLSELLNSTSVMGTDYGFPDRYDSSADWTPAGMKLFKDEKNVPEEILHRKLEIRKSLNQVILSKVFVKSLFENLNMERVIERFDDQSVIEPSCSIILSFQTFRFVVDKFFVQPLTREIQLVPSKTLEIIGRLR